jgi:hypothetical protein
MLKFFNLFGILFKLVSCDTPNLEAISVLETTWEFLEDLKTYKEIKLRTKRMLKAEIIAESCRISYFQSEEDIEDLITMVGKYNEFVYGALGENMVKEGVVHAARLWINSGPEAFAGLLAADEISGYFSDEAVSLYKRVAFLDKVIKVLPLASAIISVKTAKGEVEQIGADINLGMVSAKMGFDITVWALAKKGMISITTKGALSKFSGPIGWAIFVGQVGQIGIKMYYLNENIENTKKDLWKEKEKYDRIRQQNLDEINELKKIINKSGYFPFE